jgi:hypothetical protein
MKELLLLSRTMDVIFDALDRQETDKTNPYCSGCLHKCDAYMTREHDPVWADRKVSACCREEILSKREAMTEYLERRKKRLTTLHQNERTPLSTGLTLSGSEPLICEDCGKDCREEITISQHRVLWDASHLCSGCREKVFEELHREMDKVKI